MELQECSMQTSSTRYVKELLPLLRRIHRLNSIPSCSLTTREKAKLVRLAADLCLVKAAGGNARWGKALYRTVINENAPQYAVPKCTVETTHAETDGDHRLAPQITADIAGAKGTISLAKVKRSCDRYRHRSTQKRYRGFGICNEYFIARIPGLCYKLYEGAQYCHRGFSTLSSQCTSIHQLQHEYCQARGALGASCRGFQQLHSKSWFKKCRNTCMRPRQAPAKKVVAERSRICKTCAEPNISAATFIHESNNEDYNANNVQDMAGKIGALQKLIPGGDSLMEPASLYEETALYILALQMQVHSLSALATISATPTHTMIP